MPLTADSRDPLRNLQDTARNAVSTSAGLMSDMQPYDAAEPVSVSPTIPAAGPAARLQK